MEIDSDTATVISKDSGMVEQQLASVLPRVLIVSRRTVRKNKFVDFVGKSLLTEKTLTILPVHIWSFVI